MSLRYLLCLFEDSAGVCGAAPGAGAVVSPPLPLPGCKQRPVVPLKKKKKKISALADCHLVKLLSSHRGWEIEALSFLMITFQKDDCRFLRKTFLACSWLVDFHFRGERERLYSCKFSKVCVLRK